MTFKHAKHLRFILRACLPLALLASLWFGLTWHVKDFTKIPLNQCEYLKDVAEPITFVEGISWDDGGSLGLSFRDSRQITRDVCLANNLKGNNHLTFGTMMPDPDERVPLGGNAERAFLGLVQRWLRRNPEAQKWLRRMEHPSRFKKEQSILTGDETGEQRGRLAAIVMMRRLLRRN